MGNIEGPEFTKKGTGIDSEFPGGGGAVSAVAAEGVLDEEGLHFLERGPRKPGGSLGMVPDEVGGQVAGFDQAAADEDKGVLDDILQFPDVARIVVLHEDLEGGFGAAGDILVLAAIELGDEVLDQERDILAAVAEGGDLDIDDVDAVVEVFAKCTGLDEVAEALVAGRDDANICLDGFDGPEGLEDPLLQDAEEPGLHGGGDIADFVEEEGASFGKGESAGLVLSGVGEGPGLVAKEFGFQEGIGQGPAVDGDEFFVLSPGEVVDGPGDEFLSGSGGSFEQDGAVAGRQFREDLEEFVHSAAAADDVGEGVGTPDLLSEFLDEGKVAEGFDTADDPPVAIAEQRRGDTDGNLLAPAVHDIDGLVDQGFAGFHGLLEGTPGFADAGPKDLAAIAADGLVPGHAGNLLGGAIEGDDSPRRINGEDAVGDGIENNVLGPLARECIRHLLDDTLSVRLQ